MILVRYFWIGLITGIILMLIAFGAVVTTAVHGFSARAQPTALETFLARKALNAAIPREAKSEGDPVPNTPAVLTEARAHWADHCATCHANNGSGDTEMGRGMYPHPPDLRKPGTQNMPDGELFSIIQNGVRLSGMPAWGGPGDSDHTPEDSWKLVRFIRHLPGMTPQEEQEMEKLNPKTPEEMREEHEHSKVSEMHRDH